MNNEKDFSRNGATAQRKTGDSEGLPLRRCAVAGETLSFA
jgi:hypothetical protein